MRMLTMPIDWNFIGGIKCSANMNCDWVTDCLPKCPMELNWFISRWLRLQCLIIIIHFVRDSFWRSYNLINSMKHSLLNVSHDCQLLERSSHVGAFLVFGWVCFSRFLCKMYTISFEKNTGWCVLQWNLLCHKWSYRIGLVCCREWLKWLCG